MASHTGPSPSPPVSGSTPPGKTPGPPAAASPAGFIFVCSSGTKADCYRHRVLGLPRGKLGAVSRIRRGAAVFLYDFDAKLLYGPYRADSDGGADLVPGAFNGRFPAQVGSSLSSLQCFQLSGDRNQETGNWGLEMRGTMRLCLWEF
jgi:hypothetical protein